MDPDPAAPPPARRRRRRGNRLLLFAGLVVVPLLLLALLEVALRAVGLGDLPPAQSSRLAYQQVYPPMLEPGQRPDGSAALITNDGRVPWQALDAERAPASVRIVAVGGSATAGLGYSPNVSFPRELERLLQAAWPGRRVEVLNLGIVALASGQVRWIVDDACRRLQPDAVVVYSGNNEFLEIHAERFAGARSSSPGIAARLADTNLSRLAGGLARNSTRGRDATIFDMAQAQARVSETEIMRSVSLTPEEHAGVVDAYETNLRAMVDAGRAHGATVLLMTVAANWEWQGREDLPADWIDALLGDAPRDDGDLTRALGLVDAALQDALPAERHTWLFKRGVLLTRLRRHAEAALALREAQNVDPRQRRATDELAERVRRVASDTGTPLLDTIRSLSDADPRGIIGDAVFYDYVHFTPRGCVTVGALVFDSLFDAGALPELDGTFDPAAHAASRRRFLDGLDHDPLAIGDWMGLGDLGLVHDRELWKHQRHVLALDARLAEHPEDVDALVRRANADFFARDGYDDGVRRYERALELAPGHPEAAANLARLTSSRRP